MRTYEIFRVGQSLGTFRAATPSAAVAGHAFAECCPVEGLTATPLPTDAEVAESARESGLPLWGKADVLC